MGSVIYEAAFMGDANNLQTQHSLQLHIDGFGAEERALGDEFMEIIQQEKIKTVFQPIISLRNGDLLGYEALSRGPKKSFFENPEKLFDYARAMGRLWELEFLCRLKALDNVSRSSMTDLIFINVDPHIIKDENFRKGFTKDFLSRYNINPESIVFEITEKSAAINIESFNKLINNYKDQGYKIAIDDAGSGYSGLKLITDIHPHFIKLDMNLIRNIDTDGLKYALIKTFFEFCLVTDIKLIAEGIETENELNALIDIGIDYGQGYFIQKPSEKITNIDNDLKDHICLRNARKKELYVNRPTTVSVGDICRRNITTGSRSTGLSVLETFNHNPSLHGIPVVDNGTLVGLVMKEKFYSRLGSQYGYALYINRPISILMDNRPLCVDYEMTIDVVSKMAVTRNEECLYDYIIVTRDNSYYGIVTVKDLLEKTTELEVNYARHLNPLTGLPGNMLIEQKLSYLIRDTSSYTVLYIDIDNFKVYNDVYGFEKGDRVLQFMASKLAEILSSDCDHIHFIGHIGGDDFIVIIESHSVDAICRTILDTFDRGITGFYSESDLERGMLIAGNRHGTVEEFGLMTLSIAGVSNKERSFKDIYQLSEYSSRIKKKCKEKKCSCFHIE
jgi:EAL domain-containing protein (putative c-di-GMP-specific phosphodiesterase class I)/GGDEF domain-containing protein/CBS domain-containing protein